MTQTKTLQKETESLNRQMQLVHETDVEDFKDAVLEWYEYITLNPNSEEEVALHGIPVPDVVHAHSLEHLHDVFFSSMHKNLSENEPTAFPENIDDWEEEHYDHADETISSELHQIFSMQEHDVLVLLNHLNIFYIHNTFLSDGEEFDVANAPVAEVW